MATRSFIAVHRADGKWCGINCRYDGYVEHHGHTLVKHYGSQALAEALVGGGDLLVLAERCDEPAGGHSFRRRVEGHCIYCGVSATVGNTLAAIWPPAGIEFVYAWYQGRWQVGGSPWTLVPVADALAGKELAAWGVEFPGRGVGRRARANRRAEELTERSNPHGGVERCNDDAPNEKPRRWRRRGWK